MYSPTTFSMPQQFLGFEGKSPLQSLWYLHPGHIWGCRSCRFWQVQSMVSSTQHFIPLYTCAFHWAKVMKRLSKCLFVCVSVCTPSRSLRCLCHRSDQRSGHSYNIRLSRFLFSTFEQYDFNCCFATTWKVTNHAWNATSISASRVSPTYQWSGCPWVLAVVLFSSLEKHLGVE